MSGVEVIGVIASAAQLADVSVRLVSGISRLCRQFRDHPQNLSKRVHNLEHLIQITEIIQTMKLPDIDILRTTLENSIADAEALLTLIEPLSPQERDGKIRRGWKAVCGVAKEIQILDALRQLEERKGALLICIGVANSKLLSTVDQNILDLSTTVQDAVRGVPNIQRCLETISVQIRDLILSDHSRRIQHPCVADDTSLALSNLDIGEDTTSLEKSSIQLVESSTRPISMTSKYAGSTVGAVGSHPATEKCFLVPVGSNPLFTGRTSTLNKMKDFYFRKDHLEQKRLILTGLGGVGKTQIATAFTYETYANEYYSIVVWVFAIDKQELMKSLTQIAKSLGLCPEIDAKGEDGTSDRIAPLALALMQWLSREHSSKWLLVFDNVDDLDSFDIYTFFPKVPWGDILITSRRKQAERLGYAIVVDTMDVDEAVELLHSCSGLPPAANEVLVRDLVKALGYLPLAIDQAGAYISEQCIGFDEYMDLYGESREHLLRHKPCKAVWSYEETVFTTWEISFAAVSKSDPRAARFLGVAAFFHSDRIPLALLCNLSRSLPSNQRLILRDFLDFVKTRSDYSHLAGEMSNELKCSKLQVSQAIGRLASLSLVKQKAHPQKSISVHPLVHFWLQERQSDADRLENARAAICLVLHALINAYDLSQFANAEIIYPYLFICLEHVHTMTGLLSATELHKIGACIIAIDSWVPISVDPSTLHRADRFYDLVINRRTEAEWHIPEAMLAMRLALRLKSRGHRSKTSEHCAQYLKTFQQRTRFDKMYVACMARTSAPCFFRMGDYDGAENVYSLVDDSLDSTGAMLARKQLVLGAIKNDRGLPLEAESLLVSCANELLRGIGQEHFLLSVWHQLMATCYISQGRYKEAEDTVLKQLNGRMDMLNAGKLEFAFSDYELAEVYARVLRKQQRYEEGQIFLLDLLRKTASKMSRPARALAQLSLILTELDEATYLFERRGCTEFQFSDEERGRIEALISRAHLMFKEAAAAYEMEWNRGTWVFKHFNPTMEEYGGRLEK